MGFTLSTLELQALLEVTTSLLKVYKAGLLGKGFSGTSTTLSSLRLQASESIMMASVSKLKFN